MNENLNLYAILKECPKGTELYCTVLGNVTLHSVDEYWISVRNTSGLINTFSLNGKYYKDGECVLFPAKDQHDWSKFKVPVKKFDPKEFQPFDKVLIKHNYEDERWVCNFFSDILPNGEVHCIGVTVYECIPYNDETKHLLGTKDDCPEYYKWWEE